MISTLKFNTKELWNNERLYQYYDDFGLSALDFNDTDYLVITAIWLSKRRKWGNMCHVHVRTLGRMTFIQRHTYVDAWRYIIVNATFYKRHIPAENLLSCLTDRRIKISRSRTVQKISDLKSSSDEGFRLFSNLMKASIASATKLIYSHKEAFELR